MKRLLKQSNQIFQHATTFEAFINICNDGVIKPFNEVQNTSRGSNSLDGNSIYLSKHSGKEFALEFMNDDKYRIGVYFELNVDEKNLLPSHDFKEFTFPDDDGTWQKSNGEKVSNEDELSWEDTISINDECRYNGSINLNSIVSVSFFTLNRELENQFNDFDKKLSIDDAINLKDQIINFLGI